MGGTQRRERNKKRMRAVRKKRKEKVSQAFAISRDLDIKKGELAMVRRKLAHARMRSGALKLSEQLCKAPIGAIQYTDSSRNVGSMVSSLQYRLRSKPTASSAGLHSSLKLLHHKRRIQCQVKKLDRHSLRSISCEVGSGTFGKCMKMFLSSTEVAVKATTLDSYTYESIMYEAEVMTEICCGHPNLPLFIGVYDQPEYPKPLLVMKFYSIEGESCTLHRYLWKCNNHDLLHLVQILIGVCDGLDVIHQKGFLHNDLKCVLSDCIPPGSEIARVWPIVIDFGKARLIQSPKRYNLSEMEREEYRKKYTHLAPELIQGTSPQSTSTDVYSFGHIIHKVATITASEQLKSVASLCTKANAANRPSVAYVRSSLSDFCKICEL